MNNFDMTDRKDKSGDKAPKPNQQSRATDSAFDMWLNRGLHDMFDSVANEPVPEELLKLIEEDKKK